MMPKSRHSSAFFAKIRRDVLGSWGKLVVLGMVLGAGVFILTMVGASASVLLREMDRNYEATNPASATIELKGPVRQDLITKVKAIPGVIGARLGQTQRMRVQDAGGHWQPILIFVCEDMKPVQLGKVNPQEGPWPPRLGSFALERTALSTFGWKVGDKLTLMTEEGKTISTLLETVVHDPAVAPANQERTVYAYAEPGTLASWGLLNLNQVKIRADQSFNTGKIRNLSAEIAQVFRGLNQDVAEIQVPPAHRHPHQGILTTLLSIFGIFGVLTIVLCSLLAANAAASFLAREKKILGILKTLGVSALPLQILILTPISLTGLIAVVWGLPLGLFLFPLMTQAIAELLNFSLVSLTPDFWSWLVPLSLGLLTPVFLTLPVSLRTQKASILSALNDQGTDGTQFQTKGKTSYLGKRFPVLAMSIQNAVRKKNRLILSLVLMGVGGGLFLTSSNLTQSWESSLEESFRARKFDYQLSLVNNPQAEDLAVLRQELGTVLRVEVWHSLPVTTLSTEGLAIDITYPDEAHGSFKAYGTPDTTAMVQFPVVEGSWTHHKGEVVINQSARARLSTVPVGGTGALFLAGQKRDFVLRGVVKELGQAAVYLDPAEFEAFGQDSEQRHEIFLALDPGFDRSQTQWALIQWTEERQLSLETLIDSGEFQVGGTEHFSLLILLIMMMGLVTGAVGWLGISSLLSLAVIERRREMGILRSLGATPGTLVSSLLAEAGILLILGFFTALILSLLFSAALGAYLGLLSSQTPLALSLNFPMVMFWFFVSLTGGILACLPPALRAARQTIREILNT